MEDAFYGEIIDKVYSKSNCGAGAPLKQEQICSSSLAGTTMSLRRLGRMRPKKRSRSTNMTDPERAQRLWLAIAVATLWVVSVGGEVDANLPVSCLEALPQTHIARRSVTRHSRPRLLSCFARGIITIVGMLIRTHCGLPEFKL